MKLPSLSYQQTQNQSPIGILSDGQNEVNQLTEGQQGLLFVPQTSFYAESGGQVGDQGTIQTPNGTAEVFDCIKIKISIGTILKLLMEK